MPLVLLHCPDTTSEDVKTDPWLSNMYLYVPGGKDGGSSDQRLGSYVELFLKAAGNNVSGRVRLELREFAAPDKGFKWVTSLGACLRYAC